MPDPVDGVYALEDWSNRWREGRAGWHRDCVNPMLEKHFDRLVDGRTHPLRIFVPLCGKTVDLKWMFDRGHIVIGLEFDEAVVRELYQESEVEIARVEKRGELQLFTNGDGRLKVYQGDFFEYKREFESDPMDGIWDRGSLVAVNVADREKYVSIVTSTMAPTCRYLLDTLEYDLSQYTGVPHSTTDEDIRLLYESRCNIEPLERKDALVERWKKQGLTWFDEKVHLITPKPL